MWSNFLSLLKDNLCHNTSCRTPPPPTNCDVCNLLATKLIMIRISECAAPSDRWLPSKRPFAQLTYNQLHPISLSFFFFPALKSFATS